MAEIIIKVPVPDSAAEFFSTCDVIVTPGTDAEIQWLGQALASIEATFAMNVKAIATLIEVLETKGNDPSHIAKTLLQMREPNRLGVGQIEYARTFLGRSARVGQAGIQKGKLQ